MPEIAQPQERIGIYVETGRGIERRDIPSGKTGIIVHQRIDDMFEGEGEDRDLGVILCNIALVLPDGTELTIQSYDTEEPRSQNSELNTQLLQEYGISRKLVARAAAKNLFIALKSILLEEGLQIVDFGPDPDDIELYPVSNEKAAEVRSTYNYYVYLREFGTFTVGAMVTDEQRKMFDTPRARTQACKHCDAEVRNECPIFLISLLRDARIYSPSDIDKKKGIAIDWKNRKLTYR